MPEEARPRVVEADRGVSFFASDSRSATCRARDASGVGTDEAAGGAQRAVRRSRWIGWAGTSAAHRLHLGEEAQHDARSSAAAGTFGRESCWMDSIVGTCHTSGGGGGVPREGRLRFCRYDWAERLAARRQVAIAIVRRSGGRGSAPSGAKGKQRGCSRDNYSSEGKHAAKVSFMENKFKSALSTFLLVCH